jgi:hypothetical protein
MRIQADLLQQPAGLKSRLLLFAADARDQESSATEGQPCGIGSRKVFALLAGSRPPGTVLLI